MYLPDAHVLDAGRRCSFYINRAPDSRIDKLRPPVPAKHRMCLAHQLVSFHRTAGDIVNGFIFLIGILFYKMQHGAKDNADFIPTQTQKVFYQKTVRAVHIICVRKHFSIDQNLRQRVEPFADQRERVLCHQRFICIKAAHELILLPKKFPNRILIFSVIRMRKLSRRI